MAYLPQPFDPTQVDPSQSFEPIPPDWYQVAITNSSLLETKDKMNSYLKLELSVLNGPFAGRKIFNNLNLYHSNATAVEIAQRELSAICWATGVFQVQDSTQLHGIPFQAKVTIREAQGNYGPQNEIKGYRNSMGIDPSDLKAGKAPGGSVQPGAPMGIGYPPPQAPQPAYNPQQYAPPSYPPQGTGVAPAGYPPQGNVAAPMSYSPQDMTIPPQPASDIPWGNQPTSAAPQAPTPPVAPQPSAPAQQPTPPVAGNGAAPKAPWEQ